MNWHAISPQRVDVAQDQVSDMVGQVPGAQITIDETTRKHADESASTVDARSPDHGAARPDGEDVAVLRTAGRADPRALDGIAHEGMDPASNGRSVKATGS